MVKLMVVPVAVFLALALGSCVLSSPNARFEASFSCTRASSASSDVAAEGPLRRLMDATPPERL